MIQDLVRISSTIENMAANAHSSGLGAVPQIASEIQRILFQIRVEVDIAINSEIGKFIDGALPYYNMLNILSEDVKSYHIPFVRGDDAKAFRKELEGIGYSYRLDISKKALEGNVDNGHTKVSLSSQNQQGHRVWKLESDFELSRFGNYTLSQRVTSLIDPDLVWSPTDGELIEIEHVVDSLKKNAESLGIKLYTAPRVNNPGEFDVLATAVAEKIARDDDGKYRYVTYDQEKLCRLRVERDIPKELGHGHIRLGLRTGFRTDWYDPADKNRLKLEVTSFKSGLAHPIEDGELNNLVWHYFVEQCLDDMLVELEQALRSCIIPPKEETENKEG